MIHSESSPHAPRQSSQPRSPCQDRLVLATMRDMDYQVNLDTFRGPLDLLLYLVKRNEVDICDIPIAQVAEQFLEYLRVLELIDVERAGDFQVMAATLMEIKSRMLLPHS